MAASGLRPVVILLSLIRSEIDGNLEDLVSGALAPAEIDALVRDIEGDVERVRQEVDKLLRGSERSPGDPSYQQKEPTNDR